MVRAKIGRVRAAGTSCSATSSFAACAATRSLVPCPARLAAASSKPSAAKATGTVRHARPIISGHDKCAGHAARPDRRCQRPMPLAAFAWSGPVQCFRPNADICACASRAQVKWFSVRYAERPTRPATLFACTDSESVHHFCAVIWRFTCSTRVGSDQRKWSGKLSTSFSA